MKYRQKSILVQITQFKLQVMYKSRNNGGDNHYQAAQRALEQQTATLLAERRRLESKNPTREEQRSNTRQNYNESAPITPVVLDRNSENPKTEEVVNRLQQIIKLCKEEGSLTNDQMREIIKVQNEVLGYLQRAHAEPGHHNAGNTNQDSYLQRAKGEVYLQKTSAQPQPRVIRPQTETSPELKKSKSNRSKNNIHANNQTWGKDQRPFLQSQDTIQIIAEIERKALNEIIHLQQERDNLKKQRDQFAAELQRIKRDGFGVQQHSHSKIRQQHQNYDRVNVGQAEIDRLRHQNRLLKEQNQALHARLELGGAGVGRDGRKTDYRQTNIDYQDNRLGLAFGQYDSQIAVYQNQLRRATVVINELRSRLAHVPGLEELHEQGEKIRRQTSQLLQFKAQSAGQGNNDYALIRELQERLEEEEKGKAAFLQELKVFKQRYIDLQEENRAMKKNRVSFDPVPRPAGLSQQDNSVSRSIMKKKANYLGEYEQTLNEMKRALY